MELSWEKHREVGEETKWIEMGLNEGQRSTYRMAIAQSTGIQQSRTLRNSHFILHSPVSYHHVHSQTLVPKSENEGRAAPDSF